MNDHILHDHNHDGIDRKGFLKCMAWAGTGVIWTLSSGVLTSRVLGQTPALELPATPPVGTLNFVQISDSHIGFSKPANKDVTATFREAVSRINALAVAPEFLIHTGDLTHLAEEDEFDGLSEMLKDCRTKQVFYVPGEHDILNDNGAAYRARFGKGSLGSGWYSFDQKGVHFVGLVNVDGVTEGGLGIMGEEQLAWLAKDLGAISSETPVVVFAHVPLWEVYPKWGWGTADGARALALLKRFGSVTVLNGHIHQVVQKIEGNITFHTARSTAFPQPEPGTAPKPGPMLVDAPKLRSIPRPDKRLLCREPPHARNCRLNPCLHLSDELGKLGEDAWGDRAFSDSADPVFWSAGRIGLLLSRPCDPARASRGGLLDDDARCCRNCACCRFRPRHEQGESCSAMTP
jgi:Icc protein